MEKHSMLMDTEELIHENGHSAYDRNGFGL